MFNRIITLLLGIVLLLTACGQTATPAPLPTGAPLPTSAVGDIYEPIAEVECSALRQDIAAVLGVEFEQETGPFEDYALGGRGTGCLLHANGTGVDFGSELAVTSALQFLLEDQGWVIDIRYTADGPTGTAFGLRQENRLALVSVIWIPSDDADCPADRPISECSLTPDQVLYTITVQVAEQ